jgi:hypothetical protein
MLRIRATGWIGEYPVRGQNSGYAAHFAPASPTLSIDCISFYAYSARGEGEKMAQTTPTSRILQIQLQTGTTATGQPKVQNHNYPNVALNASDDDILAVGQALAALYSEPVVGIARVDQVAISSSTPNAGT